MTTENLALPIGCLETLLVRNNMTNNKYRLSIAACGNGQEVDHELRLTEDNLCVQKATPKVLHLYNTNYHLPISQNQAAMSSAKTYKSGPQIEKPLAHQDLEVCKGF